MGIKSIKQANSIKTLMHLLKDAPKSMISPVIKLITIKDHKQRVSYLKTLPEDTLIYLLKATTYLILSSGVVLKESVHEVYLTPEIKSFFNKVKEHTDKAGEITKETVSLAVDAVIGTISFVTVAGIVSLGAFLLLNPHIALAAASASMMLFLFTEMLIFLIPSKNKN
ncbi:hypothetical protein [Metabacillus fastidiosus]|uniref:Membrane transport protein MMPL domain-containing protein n=1 Tax=Metabacillus fastidiosus TaxID=1458 RepID=A0ABU6P436_9BACI|nr:hypothetical protein [Metabacillus fastidiosus]